MGAWHHSHIILFETTLHNSPGITSDISAAKVLQWTLNTSNTSKLIDRFQTPWSKVVSLIHIHGAPRSTQEWVFHGASHNQDIQLPALQRFLFWGMDFAVTFCLMSSNTEQHIGKTLGVQMFVVIPDGLCALYLYWFYDDPYSKRPFGSQNHSQQGHSYLSRHTCTRNCRRSTLQKPLHMPKSTPLQWKYMMMYLACGDLGSASTLGWQQDEIPTPSVLVAPINGKTERSTVVLDYIADHCCSENHQRSSFLTANDPRHTHTQHV